MNCIIIIVGVTVSKICPCEPEYKTVLNTVLNTVLAVSFHPSNTNIPSTLTNNTNLSWTNMTYSSPTIPSPSLVLSQPMPSPSQNIPSPSLIPSHTPIPIQHTPSPSHIPSPSIPSPSIPSPSSTVHSPSSNGSKPKSMLRLGSSIRTTVPSSSDVMDQAPSATQVGTPTHIIMLVVVLLICAALFVAVLCKRVSVVPDSAQIPIPSIPPIPPPRLHPPSGQGTNDGINQLPPRPPRLPTMVPTMVPTN